MSGEAVTPQTVNIDIAEIAQIALKGIRRAYVFMGLGLDAASDSSVTNVHLGQGTRVQIVPQEISGNVLANYKASFAGWITANGLREIVESFGLFLNRVYFACLLISTSGMADKEGDNRKRAKSFEWLGEHKKLNRLSKEFGVTSALATHIQSLNTVRNCLTHRWGIVHETDCNEPGKLVVSWARHEIVAQPESGEEIVFPPNFEEPIELKGPATIGIRFVEARKEFPVKSPVALEPGDLEEICVMMIWATDEIRRSLVEFAQKCEIPIRAREGK